MSDVRLAPSPKALERPVVIVGMGAAGLAAQQELLARDPSCSLVVYGRDWSASDYGRSIVGGWSAPGWPALSPHDDSAANAVVRYDSDVVAIHRGRREVVDSCGHAQGYSDLILATGLRASLPPVPGRWLPGVYPVSALPDLEPLAEGIERSHRIVIVGAGVLALEAARLVRESGGVAIVIDQSDTLLSHRWDADVAKTLKRHLALRGVELLLDTRVEEILGFKQVEAVRFASGRVIACDAVVLAVGMAPDTRLAAAAGLEVGYGVKVNDYLETSDPHIFAVGACAEHRGRLYTSMASSAEQAAVVAQCILRGRVPYRGSLTACRARFFDTSIVTLGRGAEHGGSLLRQQYKFSDSLRGVYRKIVVSGGRLVGAQVVGDWDELERVHSAIAKGRAVWPWQVRQFLRSGALWSRPATPAGESDRAHAGWNAALAHLPRLHGKANVRH